MSKFCKTRKTNFLIEIWYFKSIRNQLKSLPQLSNNLGSLNYLKKFTLSKMFSNAKAQLVKCFQALLKATRALGQIWLWMLSCQHIKRAIRCHYKKSNPTWGPRWTLINHQSNKVCMLIRGPLSRNLKRR